MKSTKWNTMQDFMWGKNNIAANTKCDLSQGPPIIQ